MMQCVFRYRLKEHVRMSGMHTHILLWGCVVMADHIQLYCAWIVGSIHSGSIHILMFCLPEAAHTGR